MMANPEKITQQMIDFQKETFLKFYDAAAMMQNHAASAVNMTLDQAAWIPNEGRQAILSWMDAYQGGCEQLKDYVQDSFSSIEKYFVVQGPKPNVAKAPKKAAARKKKVAVTK